MGEVARGDREKLLVNYVRSSSRHLVHNDKAWQVLLDEKTRQVESLEKGVQDILALCAESEIVGFIPVEKVYEILGKVRS